MRNDLDAEGVTHYRLTFTKAPPAPRPLVREINGWRSVLHTLKWIGQDPARYRGVGFGNISRRINPRSNAFLISGTQTGRRPRLTERHYAVVTHCDPRQNRVTAHGPLPPSSESMTHWTIYDLDRAVRVVIHVHAPLLWNNARRLNLLMTPRTVAYGTPEMADAVTSLFRKKILHREKLFAMGGHRDGVVSFGSTADEAAERLLRTAARALSA